MNSTHMNMIFCRVDVSKHNEIFFMGIMQNKTGFYVENYFTLQKLYRYVILLSSQNNPFQPGRQPNSQTPVNLLQPWQFGPQGLAQFKPYLSGWHAK